MKRVGVYVDMRNQYDSPIRRNSKIVIDYALYLKECVAERELYRAFAYGVYTGNQPTPFIGMLRSLGYEANYRKAAPDQFLDCNLQMTADIWRCIDRIDVVVIGSNDTALIPIISRIRETGRIVEMFSLGIPRELMQAANACTEINLERLGRRNASSENAESL